MKTMNIKTPLFHIMTAAAQKAGRALVRDFGEVEQLQASQKGPVDFTDKATKKSEKLICNELTKARPKYGLVIKNTGTKRGPDISNYWIIDPLNGYFNFLHGIPHFCTAIALERDRRIEAAVIYQPVADELYFAERGQGAFLNDRRLRVSARNTLADSIFATSFPSIHQQAKKDNIQELAEIMARCSAIRSLGSTALDLAYVASGRYEGYWDKVKKKWEIAAGALIVKEAGGIVVDFNGTDKILEYGNIIASNANLDQQFSTILKPFITKKLAKAVEPSSPLSYPSTESGFK